jgi:hypothetical protein
MRTQRWGARLQAEDPGEEAAAVDALWADLARTDPAMFAELWRRATRRGMVRAEAAQAIARLLDTSLPV